MTPRARNPQAGLTLIEIMIAMAILAFMMSLVWTTTSRTSQVKRTYDQVIDRNTEVRVGLARVVADLEEAYLSKNEDLDAFERRTRFVGKSGGDVDDLTFSSLAHQVLWADANESEQTMITYYAAPDREDGRVTNWLRREQRRLTDPQTTSKETPADVDVVLRDIEKVQFEYWDWKNNEWRSEWDSTKFDAQKDRLPTRVRITVTYKDGGEEAKLSTQARLYLQEPVESGRFGSQGGGR